MGRLSNDTGSQQLGPRYTPRMGPTFCRRQSRVQDQEEMSLEEVFKLGFHHHLVQMPRSCHAVGHATRPPPNKGNQLKSGSCSISLKIGSWATAWRVIKGKGSLFGLRQGQNTKPCQESAPVLRELLFQSPCADSMVSLSMVYCLVMCPQQSPGHPPVSSSSPP